MDTKDKELVEYFKNPGREWQPEGSPEEVRFLPGTSKWNKIGHRMFCHITENWRGRPLVSPSVVVDLIGNRGTKAGLRINA